MIDKIIYGQATNALYINEYRIKEDYIEVHIYGGRYEAYIKISKEDYQFATSYHWSLMNVGREGNKRLTVTTVINRKSINLARLLLEVVDCNLRVEHKDRNSLNFLRDNIYIVNKNEKKQQKSINGENETLGVNAHVQLGRITGYSVDYKIDNKIHTKYFGKREYGDISNAKYKAIEFRKSLL